MINLLKEIYNQYGFEVENDDNIMLSAKGNQEYYLTVEYEENEIKNFFEIEKSDCIINFFERNKDKLDFEKNTSLVICLKLPNLQCITSEIKNMIFEIEEDAYYFKKYVIIYTEKSIENINLNCDIKKKLHNIVNKESMFDEFQIDCYKNEEYLLAMELFIKLPFITYEEKNSEFKPLEIELEKEIILSNVCDINQITMSFKNENSENIKEIFLRLEKEFLSEEKENDVVKKFFKYFEVL